MRARGGGAAHATVVEAQSTVWQTCMASSEALISSSWAAGLSLLFVVALTPCTSLGMCSATVWHSVASCCCEPALRLLSRAFFDALIIWVDAAAVWRAFA